MLTKVIITSIRSVTGRKMYGISQLSKGKYSVPLFEKEGLGEI